METLAIKEISKIKRYHDLNIQKDLKIKLMELRGLVKQSYLIKNLIKSKYIE